jgi:hypothetical protein
MTKSLLNYDNKHVVFCEGSTDIGFFKTLFSLRLNTNPIALQQNVVLDSIDFVDGGGDTIRNKIKEELLKPLGAIIPKSITVLIDGDNNEESKLKHWKKTFDTATHYEFDQNNVMALKQFNQYQSYTIKQGELISKPVQMGVFTVQGTDFKDLETMCLKIATHLPNPKYQAVLTGFEDNCNNLPQKPKFLDKAKAQVYLASMEQWCDCKFSAGLNKGYLDKDHEVLSFLDPIVEVLKTL